MHPRRGLNSPHGACFLKQARPFFVPGAPARNGMCTPYQRDARRVVTGRAPQIRRDEPPLRFACSHIPHVRPALATRRLTLSKRPHRPYPLPPARRDRQKRKLPPERHSPALLPIAKNPEGGIASLQGSLHIRVFAFASKAVGPLFHQHLSAVHDVHSFVWRLYLVTAQAVNARSSGCRSLHRVNARQ